MYKASPKDLAKNNQNPQLWLKHQDYYWYENEAQSKISQGTYNKASDD